MTDKPDTLTPEEVQDLLEKWRNQPPESPVFSAAVATALATSTAAIANMDFGYGVQLMIALTVNLKASARILESKIHNPEKRRLLDAMGSNLLAACSPIEEGWENEETPK